MNIDMNDNHIMSVTQLTELVKFGNGVKFKSRNKEETYEWIGRTLTRFRYLVETKKNKGIIKKYIVTMTGYSCNQIDKLIDRKRKTGKVFLKERTQHVFPTKFDPVDIGLLADVSIACQHPNGKAMKKMLCEMYHMYNDLRFERLKQISVSHIYNLRKTNIFKNKALVYTKTNPVKVNIGERRKPRPNGLPGYIRVDSVHQGDLDKQKGVYHINMVDEVTQSEAIGCTEGISEQFLLPLLQELLGRFPFTILGFHSDNGSEYINQVVAKLLNNLLIDQTKSRSRKTNDNALVECKNGSVIRKYMGYTHIQKKYAGGINKFYREYMDDYINFHRHCAFATDYVDEKGKIKKRYDTYLTPVQKLLSLPCVERYLKPGITKELLIQKQMAASHFEAGKKLQEAKSKLFTKI